MAVLQGGSNKLGTLFDRKSTRLPDTKLHRWKQVIEYRARKLEALAIQYVHVHASIGGFRRLGVSAR